MERVALIAPTTENAFRQLWGRPRYPGFLLLPSWPARISSSMFNTAGVLLVLARTHSAPVAGITAAAAVVPAALSGPVLGAWLDVVRQRRVLIVLDQVLSVAGLLAVVELAGHAPDWTIPAVTVLYSFTRPFSQGSFFSALADIAGAELLDQASTIEATSLNLAIVVGPAMAGALAGIIGAAETVELQAVLTVVVAVLVGVNPAFEARPAERAESVSHALRTGLTALRRQRVLLATSFSSSLAAFSWGLMLIGFPLYAAQMLHSAPHASGYLWAAVAAGSILGTFVLHGPPGMRRVWLLLRDPGPVGGAVAAGRDARGGDRPDRPHRLSRGARLLGHHRAASASRSVRGAGAGDDHGDGRLPAGAVGRGGARRRHSRSDDADRDVRRGQPRRRRRRAESRFACVT